MVFFRSRISCLLERREKCQKQLLFQGLRLGAKICASRRDAPPAETSDPDVDQHDCCSERQRNRCGVGVLNRVLADVVEQRHVEDPLTEAEHVPK